jgi:transcriptional regulator with XRE-family HTH domain
MRTEEIKSLRALNEWRKQKLSERLRALMDKKGLSVAAAAKLVLERLPGGTFNSANISHYRAGRSLPRPTVLKALSDVLDVDPEDLAPSQASRAVTQFSSDNGAVQSEVVRQRAGSRTGVNVEFQSAPAFHIADLPGGDALLQINQRLSWHTAIRVLQALKGEGSSVERANAYTD